MHLMLLLPEMEKACLFVGFYADLPHRVAGGTDSGAKSVFVRWLLREDHRLPPGMGGGNLLHWECGADCVVDVGLTHRAGHAGNFNCCSNHLCTFFQK